MVARACFCLTTLLLVVNVAAHAESPSAAVSNESAQEPGIPLSRVIATVAHKSGKRFLVDPRAHTDVVLIGQDPSAVTYSELLTILHLNGFAAVESGGYVSILPDANIRFYAPLVTSKETKSDADYVTVIVPVKSVSAAQLVPILRPMVPQQGHLAAYPCRNTLIIIDTFANVRRIEAVVHQLDTGEPYPVEKSCEPKSGRD